MPPKIQVIKEKTPVSQSGRQSVTVSQSAKTTPTQGKMNIRLEHGPDAQKNNGRFAEFGGYWRMSGSECTENECIPQWGK